jgi:ATP-dependent RNA helicase DeaD
VVSLLGNLFTGEKRMLFTGIWAEALENIDPLDRGQAQIDTSPFQKKLFPLIDKGRNVIIETGGKKKTSASWLFPIVAKLKLKKPAGPVLIITDSVGEIDLFHKTCEYLVKKQKTHAVITALGVTPNVRKESSVLHKKADIIISTAERIIDHIRRENLDLSKVRCCVLSTQEKDQTGYTADLNFIFAKIDNCEQIILLLPELNESATLLQSLIPRPVVFQMDDVSDTIAQHLYYILPKPQDMMDILTGILGRDNRGDILILTGDSYHPEDIGSKLKKTGIETFTVQKDFKFNNLSSHLNKMRNKVLIAEQGEEIAGRLGGFKSLIYLSPPTGEIYRKNYQLITGVTKAANIILIIKKNETSGIEEIQEKNNVAIQKKELENDNQNVKKVIQDIVAKIKEEEDPNVLNEYKSMVKKYVPLTLRAYFTAYLFKLHHGGGEKPQDANHTSLFISIGKNRKVFPRDIVQLFTGTGKIKRANIGDIKILDNYSFVEVSNEFVESVIQELNDKDFRGKKLTVNYARRKD